MSEKQRSYCFPYWILDKSNEYWTLRVSEVHAHMMHAAYIMQIQVPFLEMNPSKKITWWVHDMI